MRKTRIFWTLSLLLFAGVPLVTGDVAGQDPMPGDPGEEEYVIPADTAGEPNPSEPSGTSDAEGDESEAAPPPAGWWSGVLGAPAPDGLYLGLWTLHLRRTEDGVSSHHLLGVGWNGVYAKTFVNSFGDRTWGIGVHRSFVSLGGEGAALNLGIRAGVLHGYDERMHDLLGAMPLMPAAEVVGTANLGRVGVQATWAALVTSVGVFVPLGGG